MNFFFFLQKEHSNQSVSSVLLKPNKTIALIFVRKIKIVSSPLFLPILTRDPRVYYRIR